MEGRRSGPFFISFGAHHCTAAPMPTYESRAVYQRERIGVPPATVFRHPRDSLRSLRSRLRFFESPPDLSPPHLARWRDPSALRSSTPPPIPPYVSLPSGLLLPSLSFMDMETLAFLAFLFHWGRSRRGPTPCSNGLLVPCGTSPGCFNLGFWAKIRLL